VTEGLSPRFYGRMGGIPPAAHVKRAPANGSPFLFKDLDGLDMSSRTRSGLDLHFLTHSVFFGQGRFPCEFFKVRLARTIIHLDFDSGLEPGFSSFGLVGDFLEINLRDGA
jgi:hypothetical protein